MIKRNNFILNEFRKRLIKQKTNNDQMTLKIAVE